jgi:uncharacterized membrane protein YraQ (UPF0718 family)
MSVFIDLLQGGWNALLKYLSAHVLTCLIPAFFIAGAIAVFISQGAILKYFGPKANKLLSYGIASVSGPILESTREARASAQLCLSFIQAPQ